MRLRPRGLRVRSAGGFALLALVLSVALSVGTYQVARRYLLDQRQGLATSQAVLHAQIIDGQLAGRAQLRDENVLAALAQTRGRAVLLVEGTWYAPIVDLNERRIPAGLLDLVRNDVAGRQRISFSGVPYFLIGVPTSSFEGGYFEFVPATEYESTLRTLAAVLAIGATVTTLVGALLGWVLSRRVLRPLRRAAETAQAMSDGDLQQRLEVGDDPDLLPFADSFNTMAESLEARIAREQRFTADVSHELRTPLTAMGSAVALARRSGSRERTEFAIDVIADQVDHLRRLTLELLDLSRIDAHRIETALDPVDVTRIVARQAELHGAVHAVVTPAQPVLHVVDPVRFERVVGNLIENALRYGGGATRIECARQGTVVRLTVDDAGPGVPLDERTSIFGRFHRGSAEAPPGLPKGTGLGLSLVDEFVRLDGGRVWVEDSPDGGARFVVELPPAVQ